MILHSLVALLFGAWLATAHSIARDPLTFLGVLDDPRIKTYNGRVNAYSRFDVEFNPHQGHERIRLSLEPNHDVIAQDAVITYLNADGSESRREAIDRLDHKVFKGVAWLDRGDGRFERAGWARLSVLRDGIRPLFEGAFSVHHNTHHIQLSSTFMRTKHALDPELELLDDEYMVLFRDSDIRAGPWHSDLRRGIHEAGCSADLLDFNVRPDHPVYTGLMKRDDGYWGVTSGPGMFGKRQIDTQGGGNSAGVNLASTVGQTAGCPTTRKVALVGVASDCTYTAKFNSTETTRSTIISTMNSASQVWESTFNISLGLQELTVMESTCPGTPEKATAWNQVCTSGATITDRLNLFSAWRGTLNDANSHWTLFTACNTGAAVGLAWLGQACIHGSTTSNSTGGTNETISGANVVALTSTEWQVVAHETGHTFGAVHDCTSQTCADSQIVSSQQCCPLSSSTCDADNRYIMNPYAATGITNFSPCTIGNICSGILRNSVNATCLVDNRNVKTITGQQCGNGIVEQGEDCDCGGEAGCGDDPCCDPTTCKFKTGAVCDDANDDCCTSCQFSAKGQVCRASTGDCDPAEFCSGTSSSCPNDIVAPDGQSCTNSNTTESGLACASGQCTSRDLQCQTVMGGLSFVNPNGGGPETTDPNSTFACNDNTCVISCQSPTFGPNMCYSMNQNFLDGTPCGGGGHCSNGNCEGSSFGKEIESWINQHKGIVIGVACGIGVLLLLTLLSCFAGCCRRRKQRRFQEQQMKNAVPYPQAPLGGWYAPHPHRASRPRQEPATMRGGLSGDWSAIPKPGPQQTVRDAGVDGRAPGSPDAGAAPGGQADWQPSPPPVPAHTAQQQGPLYGGGIIGSSWSTGWRPPPPPPGSRPFSPPAYPHYSYGSGSSMRYG